MDNYQICYGHSMLGYNWRVHFSAVLFDLKLWRPEIQEG